MNTTHTIRQGETLTSIARRYGANINDLKTLNAITNPKALIPGTELQIPAFRPFDTPPPQQKPLANRPTEANSSVRWLQQSWDDVEQTFKRIEKLWHGLADAVIHPIRETESAEAVHGKSNVPLERRDSSATSSKQKTQRSSKASQSKLHRDEVLKRLRDRLESVPPVIAVNRGVQLTANERKKIIVGIGLCEVNNQVFAAQNSDQEFVGRKFGRHGIETSYSRIVHIGLSYGYIQFTQDSGSLGKLLKRMRDADKTAFDDVFRSIGAKTGNDPNRNLANPNVDLLIHLTNEGLDPDEIAQSYRHIAEKQKSGQGYWNHFRKTPEGKEISTLANQDKNNDKKSDLPELREVRGPRVHPIPFRPGEKPEDIWTGNWALAFAELGRIPKFQDIQLEQAVEDYFNKALPHCREQNIRTAKTLAFIGACRVRGAKETTFVDIGRGLGFQIPFERNTKELELLKAISDCYKPNVKGQITLGGVHFDVDEARRAALLLKNEFNFLDEDYYDTNSY